MKARHLTAWSFPFLIAAAGALAGDIIFVGGAGSFNDPTRWIPNQVPGVGDTAYITNSGTFTVEVLSSVTCERLILGGPEGRQTLRIGAAGVGFTLNGSSVVNSNGALRLEGGVLLGPGALTVMGEFAWSHGGELRGNGALILTNGGVLHIDSTVPLPLASRVVQNAGTADWTGSGDILNEGGASFHNLPGGLFIVSNDQIFGRRVGSATTIQFHNAGVLRKAAGTGTSSFGHVSFFNSGTVDVQTGAWDFGNASTFSSGTTFSGAGWSRLAGNPVSVNGAIAAENLELAGGALLGSFTNTGRFVWSGGALSGSGTLTVPEGSSLVLTGGTAKSFGNYTIENSGDAVWSDLGDVHNAGGGAFYNRPSGRLAIENDQVFGLQTGSAPQMLFHNEGTIEKRLSHGTTAFLNVTFNNASNGLVRARTGTVAFAAGGSCRGRFEADAGAAFHFSGGTHQLSGASWLGEGVVRLGGGTWSVNGPCAAQRLEFSAGTLLGSAALAIQERMNWSGGNLAGSGTVDISSNAVLNIIGTNTLGLGGRTINNHGLVTWSGNDHLYDLGGGVFNNLTNDSGPAVFEVQNDQVFGSQVGGSAGVTFNNSGVFRKSSGSGASSFGNVTIKNSGVFDVQSGILSFNVNVALAEGSQFTGAGLARVNQGTVTVNGTTLVNGTLELASGTITGPGTMVVNSNFLWSGGQLANPGAISVSPGGALIIGGSADKVLANGRIIENAGRIDWTGTGAIVGRDSAAINNDGVCNALGDAVFQWFGGSAPPLFNNNGIFNKVSGAGATTFSSVPFHNRGQVNTLTGTMALAGGGASSGIFNAEAGTSIDFTVNHVLTNSPLFTGAGTNRITGPVVTVSEGAVARVEGQFHFTSGQITGPGTITVPGEFSWFGGQMDTPGVLQIEPGGILNLAGNSGKLFTGGRVITNAGTVNWTGNGRISGRDGAIFHNAAAFNILNDAVFDWPNGSAPPVFNNLAGGTVTKLAGTGSSSFNNVVFNHSGMLDAQTGLVVFSSGYLNLGEGAVFTGGGTNRGQNCTVTVNGPASIAGTFEMSSGTLTGTNELTVAGGLIWSGGQILGPGSVHIAPSGWLNIGGSSTKFFSNDRVITNAGTVHWTGTGPIDGRDHAAFLNGGTVHALGDASFQWTIGTAPPAFVNSGQFIKAAGAGTSSFKSVPFINHGRVEAASGTLRFEGRAYTQEAGVTVLNGGNLAAALPLLINGGSLGGVGTISAPVSNHGQLRPGLSPGLLTIAGSYTQSASGSLAIEIGGLVAGTNYDRVAVTGPASVDGLLDIKLVDGFEPAPGDVFRILTFASRNGDFAGIQGLEFADGLKFTAAYTATALTLTTTNAPLQTPPTLAIVRSNEFAILSWPPGHVGFQLQSVTNLSSTNWIEVPVSGTNSAVLPLTDAQRFWRLFKP